MFKRPLTMLMASALSALSFLPSVVPAQANFAPTPSGRFHGARRRRKTGWLYPHSSKRQRARYARQIAAGQLNF